MSLGSEEKHSILWRGVYLPGHEYCSVSTEGATRYLAGAAVFAHGQLPCRLEYSVECNSDWITRVARVSGCIGDREIDVELSVDPARRWRLNGAERPAVKGCIDVDLNFSPATNLLPIRRLNLSIGEEAEVNAAWLRFPGFELEALKQLYRRIDEYTYRYESSGGTFIRDLKVNAFGMVTSYPGIWEEEGSGP